MIQKYWALLACCIAGLALITGLGAPHLPAMISEGFPSTSWPAKGAFVTVAGNDSAQFLTNDAPEQDLQPWLETLFRESGGTALLVWHRGTLKLEHYKKGTNTETRFNSFSMVKSLIGLLVLKAVAEGRIKNTSVSLGAFLPELTDEALKNLPLQHLLDMKSGILFETSGMKTTSGMAKKDFEKTLPNPFGPMARLHFSGLEPILEHLVSNGVHQDTFNYQNVNTALLGLILERVYQQPVETVLSEKIWHPAGARSAKWRRYPEASGISVYCCLYATPRDWIKVGRFLMTNGTRANPFLPEPAWARFMGQGLGADALRQGDYSNHTRHNVLDRSGQPLQGPFTYFIGQGGQTLYMMPGRDLVVVRFGEKHQKLHSTLYAAWTQINP